MRAALTLSGLLAWPCRLAAAAAGLGLLTLTGVILYDVIGRRFFDTGSFVMTELEWHLHGAIAVLAFGHAYLKDAHVRIDILAEAIGARRRLMLEIAAILFFVVPFCLLLMWFGWDFAHRAWTRGEGAPGGMGLPNRWIIKSAIPLSGLLTMLGALAVALRCAVALRRPDLLAEPWER
jgi:TRAP-type mannitol/chloroaromatic compound transport system permease small subunit